MTTTTTPIVISNYLPGTGQVLRLITAILMVSSLVACAVTPTQQSDPSLESAGLPGAAAMYNTRNYPGAVRAFDKTIADVGSNANTRRLAYLGKAMIYLGNDKNWHSIENAKMSLISAGQVAPADGEYFEVETDLLMDAVSAAIGSESKYAVLMSKSSGSDKQNAELRLELDELETERDELIKERKMLNEALEKLKELTLGS